MATEDQDSPRPGGGAPATKPKEATGSPRPGGGAPATKPKEATGSPSAADASADKEKKQSKDSPRPEDASLDTEKSKSSEGAAAKSGDAGKGGAEAAGPGSDEKAKREYWKTAPKLELPWPPGGKDQQKFEVGWDRGPNFTYSFPEITFPSPPMKLFNTGPLVIPTNIPALSVALSASAEAALKLVGSVKFALQKDKGGYEASAQGAIEASAEVAVKLNAGLEAGLGPLAGVGVRGQLEFKAKLFAKAGITCSLKTDKAGKNWSGEFGLKPITAEGNIAITPKLQVYAHVISWEKELVSFSIGTWTIAHATMNKEVMYKVEGRKLEKIPSKPEINWGLGAEPAPKAVELGPEGKEAKEGADKGKKPGALKRQKSSSKDLSKDKGKAEGKAEA